LQYTNWDTHGSLITLNFGEDDGVSQPVFKRRETFSFGTESHSISNKSMETRTLISTSDCESDIYEELNENEDSGIFSDSDSGISSLYETVLKYQSVPGTSSNRNSFALPATIKEHENELDSDIVSIGNHLEKLKVCSKLVHIFQRNYSIMFTSDVFAINCDLLTKLPVLNNNMIWERESVSVIKRTMSKTVTRQQQWLRTMLARKKSEKTAVDDSLILLED